MSSLVDGQLKVQSPRSKQNFRFWILDFGFLTLVMLSASTVYAQGLQEARTEKEMKAYKQSIAGTDVEFDMVPIPGGVYTMGSPASEKGHKPDEAPQVKVKIEPFWMGNTKSRGTNTTSGASISISSGAKCCGKRPARPTRLRMPSRVRQSPTPI